MKTLMALLLLGMTLSFGFNAKACPSLSGKYVDDRGFEDFLKISPDCKQLTWTIDYAEKPSHPDPKYPEVRTLYIDGVERMTLGEPNQAHVFTRGTFTDKTLVFDERREDVNGSGVTTRTRITYYLNITSVSQLVEEHSIVHEDGTTTLAFIRLYTQVH